MINGWIWIRSFFGQSIKFKTDAFQQVLLNYFHKYSSKLKSKKKTLTNKTNPIKLRYYPLFEK